MKISHITTMTRIGEIVSRIGEKKLALLPDGSITKSQLRDKRGRVYAVVVNGVIEKLGGSQDAGGIQGTIGWYLNGFAKGNSERSYCTWNFFTRAINAGKKVEIYTVWAPMVDVEIPTMNGLLTKTLPVDFHTIEKAFNDEYYEIEKKHPTLNMQESGKRWKDSGLLEGYINKQDGTVYGSQV
jgi:hypothetical protein